ncbi:MAG: polyprenol monophosphomannose synthase [Candidatus Aminicenantaceae bacterium]
MNGSQFEFTLIIPTYNERENIGYLVERINDIYQFQRLNGEILVIDDDSPDQTGEFCKELQKKHPNLNVVIRTKERGLSSAVLKGFEQARSGVYCVMDADFSHPPEAIPELIKPLLFGKADLTVGSRYIRGGGIKNWNWMRRILSRIALMIARPITGVKDPVSGFFALKKEVVESIPLNPNGFKIGLEIMAKGQYHQLKEIPYFFSCRRYGQSKLSGLVISHYLIQIGELHFDKLKKQLKRFSLLIKK